MSRNPTYTVTETIDTTFSSHEVETGQWPAELYCDSDNWPYAVTLSAGSAGGLYTRVGNMVWFSINFYGSVSFANGGHYPVISLPFTPLNMDYGYYGVVSTPIYNWSTWGGTLPVTGQPVYLSINDELDGKDYFEFVQFAADGSHSKPTGPQLFGTTGGSFSIMAQGFYLTNAGTTKRLSALDGV